MAYGIQTFSPTGELLFDSTQENVLFFIDEFDIAGVSVGNGNGISYNYTAYSGKKIVAFLTAPYGTGDVNGYAIPSCRVSGTTVSVFVDRVDAGLPVANSHLQVFFTGVVG